VPAERIGKMPAMPDVHVSPATDDALAPELAELINAAYTISEGEFWQEPTSRTSSAEVGKRIRAGEMLVASSNGRVLGCATLRPVDPTTAELGLVSVRTDGWGSGVGSELVRAADETGRTRGMATMQLKVLAPQGRSHPGRERLQAWYERLGYGLVDSLAFEQVSTHSASKLAEPCEFLVFRKRIS
jgi:N-acetylglutamate synthase-like GNAT family acetyltransferase